MFREGFCSNICVQNTWRLLIILTKLSCFFLFFVKLYDAFPGIMKWLPGPHQTIISNYQELANFLKEKVEQHRLDWDSNNPRDYIDAYLTETEKVKHSNIIWSSASTAGDAPNNTTEFIGFLNKCFLFSCFIWALRGRMTLRQDLTLTVWCGAW